jgi:hypothetical protein
VKLKLDRKTEEVYDVIMGRGFKKREIPETTTGS